jgi:hypothetical protein
MSTKRTLAILAASSVLAMFAMSPVYAEDIVTEEQDQLSNSTEPDVDPGASKGADAPIVDQERMQLGNSPEPDVPERAGKGGPSIDEQVKEGIEE